MVHIYRMLKDGSLEPVSTPVTLSLDHQMKSIPITLLTYCNKVSSCRSHHKPVHQPLPILSKRSLLLDELGLMVHPAVVGSGMRLCDEILIKCVSNSWLVEATTLVLKTPRMKRLLLSVLAFLSLMQE